MIEPIPPIEGETIDPDVPVVAGWSDAPVEGDRIDLSVSSIVAGTPGGARVEIADDGLHAYDASGVETARIIGEEGVFVGGEFRTSDALPGQVTLSDTGFIEPSSQNVYPGIRVTPADTSGYITPPGIGPNSNGMLITGGRTTTGGRGFSIYAQDETSHGYMLGSARSNVAVGDQLALVDSDDGAGNQGQVRATPSLARVRTDAADGSYGVVETGHDYAVAATRDPAGNYMSQIRSNGREAYLWSTGSDGRDRILSVDSNGAWVKTNKSGSWKQYNLEETANDSGWVAFTPEAGITPNNTSWRNKGGVMWFRGFVTATWVSGWNLVRGGFVAGEIPTFGVERPAWNVAGINYGVRMRATGDLEVYAPTAGSATIRLDGLNYPTT